MKHEISITRIPVAANLLTIVLCAAVVSANAQTNAPAKSTNQFKAKPPIVVPVKVSEPTKIKIISIDGALSTYSKCTVSGAPVGQIYIAGLPASLKPDYELIKRLEAHIAKESASIKADEKKLRADIAGGPSEAPSGTPAGNYIRQNNIRSNKITDRTNLLDEQVDRLKEARERFDEASQLTAIDTGRVYGVIPIWQIVATPNPPTKSLSN